MFVSKAKMQSSVRPSTWLGTKAISKYWKLAKVKLLECIKIENFSGNVYNYTCNIGENSLTIKFPLAHPHTQGTLTEGEGSVQLTSSLRTGEFKVSIYKLNCASWYTEVNGTERFPSLRVQCFIDVTVYVGFDSYE